MQKVDTPYLIDAYNSAKVDLEATRIAKYTWIEPNGKMSNLLYPGFVFKDEADADLYEEHVLLKYREDEITPRGNLTRAGIFDSMRHRFVFCGIKPGAANNELSKHVSHWLFGEVSMYLHSLLKDIGIYPYFTNAYRRHDSEEGNLRPIIDELTLVFHILGDDVSVVFLGNYPEYEKLSFAFRGNGIRFYRIWHPSYIVRNQGRNYDKWKEQFDNKLEITK